MSVFRSWRLTIARSEAIVPAGYYFPKNSTRRLPNTLSIRRFKSDKNSSTVKTNDTLSRISGVAEQARQSATKSLNRSVERSREWMETSGRPMLSTAWTKTREASGRGLESVKERVISAIRWSSQALVDKTKQFATWATSYARRIVARSFTMVVSGIREQISRAKSALLDPIQSRLSSAMEGFGDWSKFWWRWSLAAIGVYGIATTVPKEIVRHTLRSKDVDAEK